MLKLQILPTRVRDLSVFWRSRTRARGQGIRGHSLRLKFSEHQRFKLRTGTLLATQGFLEHQCFKTGGGLSLRLKVFQSIVAGKDEGMSLALSAMEESSKSLQATGMGA